MVDHLRLGGEKGEAAGGGGGGGGRRAGGGAGGGAAAAPKRARACSGVSFETGGRTPKPSHVRRTTLVGCEPIAGSLAFGIAWSGYAHRVFSVTERSSKSTRREPVQWSGGAW